MFIVIVILAFNYYHCCYYYDYHSALSCLRGVAARRGHVLRERRLRIVTLLLRLLLRSIV